MTYPQVGLSRPTRDGLERPSYAQVRRSEVLALTGLVGSGRTETARLIFGADRRDCGTIALAGRVLSIRRPRQAIAAGICLLTEDRKRGSKAAGPVRGRLTSCRSSPPSSWAGRASRAVNGPAVDRRPSGGPLARRPVVGAATACGRLRRSGE